MDRFGFFDDQNQQVSFDPAAEGVTIRVVNGLPLTAGTFETVGESSLQGSQPRRTRGPTATPAESVTATRWFNSWMKEPLRDHVFWQALLPVLFVLLGLALSHVRRRHSFRGSVMKELSVWTFVLGPVLLFISFQLPDYSHVEQAEQYLLWQEQPIWKCCQGEAQVAQKTWFVFFYSSLSLPSLYALYWGSGLARRLDQRKTREYVRLEEAKELREDIEWARRPWQGEYCSHRKTHRVGQRDVSDRCGRDATFPDTYDSA
jgi:hypothetical protein